MLDLPETAYRDALTFAPEERIRLASIMFATARSVDLELEPDYYRETNKADLEAIGRSLQDEAEGRIIPGDLVLVQLGVTRLRLQTRGISLVPPASGYPTFGDAVVHRRRFQPSLKSVPV